MPEAPDHAYGGAAIVPGPARPGVPRPIDRTVFQVGPGWFPEQKGGAESVFYNLYDNLGDQGFRVTGLVPGTPDVPVSSGGAMRSFPAKGSRLHRRALAIRQATRDSFAEHRPDLVACHFALYTLPMLDMLGRTPLVVHFQGPWAGESKAEGDGRVSVAVKKTVERLVYRRGQRVIVLSNAFRRIVEAEYRVPDSLVRLVPGGVDCDQFDPGCSRREARDRLGWDADRPTVFTVRRLVKRMGLDKLLLAFAQVRQQPAGRDAVLRIAGSGPERPALERQVAELGLAGAVHFEGFVPDAALPLAYRAADVTLVPTAALEGFGLVAVESLAAGTPVLVTPVGGLPEVVSDLQADMVLAGHDVASIADGLLAFLRDPAHWPSTDACRAFARARYDWPVVTAQIAAVYREMLE